MHQIFNTFRGWDYHDSYVAPLPSLSLPRFHVLFCYVLTVKYVFLFFGAWLLSEYQRGRTNGALMSG